MSAGRITIGIVDVVVECNDMSRGKSMGAGMKPDQIMLFLTESRQWRWRRVAPNGRVVCEATTGIGGLADALTDIVRVNGRPWVLQLPDGGEDVQQVLRDKLVENVASAGRPRTIPAKPLPASYARPGGVHRGP